MSTRPASIEPENSPDDQTSDNQFHFKLETERRTVNANDILEDIARIASKSTNTALSYSEYKAQGGKYESSQVHRKCGSWNKALKAVGVSTVRLVNVSNLELFENLYEVWVKLGRQPRRREMIKPQSSFTYSPYSRAFGGWIPALKAFITYVESNSDVEIIEQDTRAGTLVSADKIEVSRNRTPSLAIRWKVLKRDFFKCTACGNSPSNDSKVELEVDHVIPWSKGGSAELCNLTTLCRKCNRGKGAST